MKEFVLKNGVAIPAVGFGSFLSTDGKGKTAIKDALDAGYRYIDTASFYYNEDEIGEALAEYDIDRKDVFLCSKVWPADIDGDKTLASFEESCKKLGTDYLDMFLIHWPRLSPDDEEWYVGVRKAWAAMERLYDEGRIRAIGLSNFLPHHLRKVLETARIRPMVDQLELHVGYMQEYTLSYLKEEEILPQAWSPLGRARVINDEYISKIAAKYNKTNAQILLRYLIQRDIPVIPKASSPERLKENLDVFGFDMTEDDISYLSCLPERGWSGEHPDLPRP
ncbi:MAG: aldo/keto reductase [Lachnospiraceae bacterium]|nr:aldo/keto reductase [Lachnospiraceae bacterium]